MGIKINQKRYNNKNLKYKIISILATLILLMCVIFMIIDIIEHFTNSEMGGAKDHHIQAKAIILDYFNYWSTWAMQFAGFSAFIVLIFDLYAKYKKNNINFKFAKFIFRIQLFSLVYLLFSAITYNISLFAGKNFNDAKNFQSIIEHQLIPVLFLIYMIIDGRKIILIGKWYQSGSEFIINLILISIYPMIYISYAMIFGLHNGGYFAYSQINVNKIGWIKFWKNMLISFIIEIFLTTICYLPFTNINFYENIKKLNFINNKNKSNKIHK